MLSRKEVDIYYNIGLGHQRGQFIVSYTLNYEIFAKSIKRRICHVKNLRLGHDLPLSVNDRVISPFFNGFIFVKLRIIMRSFTKIKPS